LENKTDNSVSKTAAWILAVRPKTLPAALAPVVVGSALAFAHHRFKVLPATAALTVALLLQVGVNLANDYFDYVKGVDSGKRAGPVRVTQSGLIPPQRVKTVMLFVFGSSMLPGLYLVNVGGWPVTIVGAASIIAALAYSGGPYPLASYGLGDLFVFIFFGLVAVGGTYYVQALTLPLIVLLMGADVGLLITAILVVNNLRDLHTDRPAGKRTLAVIIGDRATRVEYTLLVASAYAVPVALAAAPGFSVWMLLPVVSTPLACRQIRIIRQTSAGPALNQALATTARLALVFSLLLSAAIILSMQ
jgi:1,4-dihydroxy-2-naphthoate octaprenyltransferase